MTTAMILVVLLPFVVAGVTLGENVRELTAATRSWVEEGPPGPPAWVGRLPVVGEKLESYWLDMARDSSRVLQDLKRFIEPISAWLLKAGLLLGRGRIERAVPVRSDPPAPDAYNMDPEQQIAVFTDMEARGELLMGIYHSHPAGPARPSGVDLQLAFHPEALYVIISLADTGRPEVGAYLLEEGQFKQVEIFYT